MTSKVQTKGSSNINININLLDMKDTLKPTGKKIKNEVKVGTTRMEAKRMTLLTQRLKQKKREIQIVNQQEKSQFLKSKTKGYSTQRQRSKTFRNYEQNMMTTYSTINAKVKPRLKNIEDNKETPRKITKNRQENYSTKDKKNHSNQKLRSRRNSRGYHSTQNLNNLKVQKSQSKSQSNDKARSTSGKKIKNLTLKAKQKAGIQANNKQTIKNTFNNINNQKLNKNKTQNYRSTDDAFIKKKPEYFNKAQKTKNHLSNLLNQPILIPLSKNNHNRKLSLKSLPKNKNYKRQKTPEKSNRKLDINKQIKNEAATTIQKIWKGYNQRKIFQAFISQLSNRNKNIQRMIVNKKKQFWRDNSENSIKYVNVQIQDSFVEQQKAPLDLFGGQQVISLQGSVQELNPFQKLIKMSHQINDSKMSKQLRSMAQNLMKQELQKKKILKQNQELKQNLIQLKQSSINNTFTIPLVVTEQDYQKHCPDQPVIIMPVKKVQQIPKPPKNQQIQKQQITLDQKVKQIQPTKVIQSSSPQKDQYSVDQQNHDQIIQKKRLIEQLKSFKGLSDTMFNKIKKKEDQPITKNKSDFRTSQKTNSQLSNQFKQVKIDSTFEKYEFNYQQMNNQSGGSIIHSEDFNKPYNLSKNQVRQSKQLTQKQVQENTSLRQKSETSQQQQDEQNQIFQKKGFETNLNFVKQYCIALCQFIRSDEQIKSKFKKQIIKPLKIDFVDFLKSYRQTIHGEINGEFSSIQNEYIYPYFKYITPLQGLIDENIFKAFNTSFSTLKMNSLDVNQSVTNLESIHLKCLLDVFNESLNYQRPSSIHGQTLPWAPKVKYLKNFNCKFQQDDKNEQQQYSKQNSKFDQIFGVSIARVIQWGSSLCGFIPESLEIDSNIEIDQEYINHIKQTRMALMLQKTLTQDEQKMLETTDAETELKLQMGLIIFNDLIEQSLQQFGIFTNFSQNNTIKN